MVCFLGYMKQHEKEALIVALYPTLKRIVRGRVNSAYTEARHIWMRLHSPIHGAYTCGVCAVQLSARAVTIDHIVMVSDAPELQLTLSNFQPCHARCNVLRGRIMTEPTFMMEMRSKPLNSWERIIVERVLAQAQEAYAAWELQKLTARD